MADVASHVARAFGKVFDLTPVDSTAAVATVMAATALA